MKMSGMKFGRWTVIERAANGAAGKVLWRCRCKCGNEGTVLDYALKIGKSRSCGCFRRDRARETKTRHGHSANVRQTSTYKAWATMVQRCCNPNNVKFPWYGGRGITVCERWRRFENFLADMGPKPSPDLSIDRINNDGNYEPGNCRWAATVEQMNNRSDNHVLEYCDERLTIAQWARKRGINPHTLKTRIRRGWSAERALKTR